MNLIIDWQTKEIFVPRSELKHISGPFYELDVYEFYKALKDAEDNDDGIVYLDTHVHYPPVSVGTITLGRVLEIINGYTVTFEDGQYAVDIVGGNTNISDVLNFNNVSVRTYNSAGLIYNDGSGNCATPQEIWSYSERTLTDNVGLTPEQESKLNEILEKVRYRSIMSSVTEVGKNTPIVFLGPTGKEFEVYYKEFNSNNFALLVDSLDEIETGVYYKDYVFTQEGSYILKFVEKNNPQSEPFFFTISVLTSIENLYGEGFV